MTLNFTRLTVDRSDGQTVDHCQSTNPKNEPNKRTQQTYPTYREDASGPTVLGAYNPFCTGYVLSLANWMVRVVNPPPCE